MVFPQKEYNEALINACYDSSNNPIMCLSSRNPMKDAAADGSMRGQGIAARASEKGSGRAKPPRPTSAESLLDVGRHRALRHGRPWLRASISARQRGRTDFSPLLRICKQSSSIFARLSLLSSTAADTGVCRRGRSPGWSRGPTTLR
jgi:hypothetical protein